MLHFLYSIYPILNLSIHLLQCFFPLADWSLFKYRIEISGGDAQNQPSQCYKYPADLFHFQLNLILLDPDGEELKTSRIC